MNTSSQTQTSIVGDSSSINQLIDTAKKIALTDSIVLICGESGTGKELVARMIHENSARKDKPMVIVNCGAIPGDLLEAELFGHVKGAFTGATQSRQGRFEMANGGTLFLDEIGELPLHLQVKLLRVLQTRQFEPVGSSQTISVNVRIVAATNRDLEDMVRSKQFREDLYYRLNVIPVKTPPLRERKTDIPLLVKHFVQKFNRAAGSNVEAPNEQILDALMSYDWPGNIRELENLMERIVILKGKGSLDLADLPHKIFQKFAESKSNGTGAVSDSEWAFPRMTLPKQGLDLKAIVEAFENHLVDQALARTNGNKNRASELLRMNRTTLVEKLRKRGMIVPAKKKNQVAAGASVMDTAKNTQNQNQNVTNNNSFGNINSGSIQRGLEEKI